MQVDIQELNTALDWLREINRANLADIDIVNNGQHIKLPTIVLEKWEYIGLANKDLLSMIGPDHQIHATEPHFCEVVDYLNR